jgi:O-antigen ligase
VLLNRLGIAGLVALPGVLTVYLGFVAGGFFPGQPAQVAFFLALVLVMVTTLVEHPFGGLGRSLGLAIAAFALFGLWTLLSSQWSGSSARALAEFNRVLAYVLALLVFGSVATSQQRLRWLLRSVALGVFVVSVAGLISRVLPDVLPVALTIQPQRLSYPITYWNTLGLMASIGIICCFALSCDHQEPPLARILGSAAIPALAVTLLFTFSRGAIGVAVVGLVVFLVVARPRLGLTAGAATVPLTAVALLVAYHADQLATSKPVVREAISQGHRVAFVVAACVILAGGARALLLVFDEPLLGYRLPDRLRPLRIPAAVVGGVVLIAILLGSGTPRAVADQYQRFLHEETVRTSNPQDWRQRLTSVGNNHRIQQWQVAVQDFEAARGQGRGAGTYELSWARYRPIASKVRDAHSLYLEVAGELGIVGVVLLAAGLMSLVAGILRGSHGPQRALYGAVFAAFIAWALEAGIDWQWEMPAVTLPILALAGAAAAKKAPGPGLDAGLSQGARVVISIGWLIVAIAPTLMAISDGRLVRAARAFNDREDCRAASIGSLSSISVLGNRPQPYEVLGYCNLERGFPVSAMQAMQKAVQQDPQNWRYRYGLAVAQGEAGLDPRAEARQALALNPRERIARQALARFGADRRKWPAQAEENADALFSTGPVGAR